MSGYAKIRNGHSDSGPPSLSKPRWNTAEFYFYYLVIGIVLPIMCWGAWEISQDTHPNYRMYEHRLSEGWMFGMKMDNTDYQYASFRGTMKILVPLFLLHVPLSYFVRRTNPAAYSPVSTHSSTSYINQPSVNPRNRIIFSLLFSLIVLSVAFGSGLIWILIILTVNFWIGRIFKGRRAGPLATWLWSITALLGLGWWDWKWGHWNDGLRFLSILTVFLQDVGYFKGMMRWTVTFNFSILRMISYNMDYYWQFRLSKEEILYTPKSGGPNSVHYNDRLRIALPHSKSHYSYFNYLTYVLYIPLYFAGPIITYNSFISQFLYPPSIPLRPRVMYFIRLCIIFFNLELFLHIFHVVAISKTRAWTGMTPFEISMVGYFNLKIIWLKLSVIWKFFRFWGWCDGIETVENMKRCMSNNYSARGFWKDWHTSYNRWLIRYVYIPLGGSAYIIYNIWPVFTFVAVWHDTSLNLLAWGWLICLFLLPEIICSKLFGTKKWTEWRYYRHLCAFGGALNIIMMMVANLVGFAVGTDGMKEMLNVLYFSINLYVFIGAFFTFMVFFTLFAASHVMMEIREDEERVKRSNLEKVED
ncbi:MBOAT, membrane-bound O-acyltransferase family-domain-containing protein [Paraphysoderma sedebokerense]|nr:MBOAT, membrane-bound O-acyltransferase family-domain-containing protein [Paraphysoderma sedebokerense]